MAEKILMEAKARILVSEGNALLRDSIRTVLEAQNFAVTAVADGLWAKKHMDDSDFSVVISNLQVPALDGLHLLSHAKRNPKARFMLIAESNVLSQEQAVQFGADAFLSVPFTKAELVAAMDGLMTPAVSEKRSKEVSDYIQVPIEEFITGTVLKVDLFLKLSETKFVKIGTKGKALELKRVERYQSRGINWLFMRRPDFAFYVGFNMTLANAAHNENKIEVARKFRLAAHVTENLQEHLISQGVERPALENACVVVLNTVELVLSNPSTFKLLEGMEFDGKIPEHSIACGVWACLIAKKLNWQGQVTFFKIALSSLFHDIGLREVAPEIQHKQRFEMSAAERRLFETHTMRGRDIINSIPGIPEDVAIVSAQHHELAHGGGFPHGLRQEQIHPLSRLITMSDQFCELVRDVEPPGKATRLQYAFELIARNHRDFDSTYLKALAEIIATAGLKAA